MSLCLVEETYVKVNLGRVNQCLFLRYVQKFRFLVRHVTLAFRWLFCAIEDFAKVLWAIAHSGSAIAMTRQLHPLICCYT